MLPKSFFVGGPVMECDDRLLKHSCSDKSRTVKKKLTLVEQNMSIITSLFFRYQGKGAGLFKLGTRRAP